MNITSKLLPITNVIIKKTNRFKYLNVYMGFLMDKVLQARENMIVIKVLLLGLL